MEANHKIKKLLRIKGFSKEDIKFLESHNFVQKEDGMYSLPYRPGHWQLWVNFENDNFVLYQGIAYEVKKTASFVDLKELIVQMMQEPISP